MSKRNSLENKRKRRELRKLRKARAASMITHRKLWIPVKDKYGNPEYKSVTMPVGSK